MTTAARFVPAVPGLCRGLCRVFHSCAGCAGSPIGVRTHRKTKNTHTPKRVLLRICTRHTRHTRHSVDSYTYFSHTPGTHPGTPGTDTHRARSLPIFSFKKDVMENQNPPPVKKVIRCTPDNARQMQHTVKAWPELHALVQTLQAQGIFPGLRALSITLEGSAAFVGGGLAAVDAINATKAV